MSSADFSYGYLHFHKFRSLTPDSVVGKIIDPMLKTTEACLMDWVAMLETEPSIRPIRFTSCKFDYE